MQRIVVTGGAGRLARLVIEDLLEHGFDVLAVDVVRPAALQCRFLLADLTDAAAVIDVLQGADAVVHLGAIPGPAAQAASRTFHNNVASTYAVLEAAAALRLQKVVWASSVFALGWCEDPHRYWPRYVPVDEAHPLTPFEGYGLSKLVGEAICAAVSQRTGMPTVSLRLMNVIPPDGYYALPWPTPTRAKGVRFVLWPYVDARDAARACRLALVAKTTGHEAVLIAARDTRFNCATRALLKELAPPDLEIRAPLDDAATVIDLTKARELIGYEPLHCWQSESHVPRKVAR